MRHQCTECEWFPNSGLGLDDPMRDVNLRGCNEVLGWNKAICPCGLPSAAATLPTGALWGVGVGSRSVTTTIWPTKFMPDGIWAYWRVATL